MKKTMETLMARWGTDMTIVSAEEHKTVRGFFRAVNSKSWQNMESVVSLLRPYLKSGFTFVGV